MMTERTEIETNPNAAAPQTGGSDERLARLERAVEALASRLDERDAQPSPAAGRRWTRPEWRDEARSRLGRADSTFRNWFERRPVLTTIAAVGAAAVLFGVID